MRSVVMLALTVSLFLVGCGDTQSNSATTGDFKEDPSIPEMVFCEACKGKISKHLDQCPDCSHPVDETLRIYARARGIIEAIIEEEQQSLKKKVELAAQLYPPKPEVVAEFTSVEFDIDDTSYSPAETHSMNQLSKELVALKEKLLERESELDARESALAMDLEALEKQRKELEQIRSDLSGRLADFQAEHGQEIGEAKLKEYKETSKRWVEMGPDVASVEIQNWRQKRRFEEALTIFEMLKAEERAAIIAFMLNSDEDALIELADALAMRDPWLLPSLDLDEFVPTPKPK
jgi:hypothetical protein